MYVSGIVFPGCPNLDMPHMPVLSKLEKHHAVLQETISPQWKGVESCACLQPERTWEPQGEARVWRMHGMRKQPILFRGAHAGSNTGGKAKSWLLLKRGWWSLLESGWECDEAPAQGGWQGLLFWSLGVHFRMICHQYIYAIYLCLVHLAACVLNFTIKESH